MDMSDFLFVRLPLCYPGHYFPKTHETRKLRDMNILLVVNRRKTCLIGENKCNFFHRLARRMVHSELISAVTRSVDLENGGNKYKT